MTVAGAIQRAILEESLIQQYTRDVYLIVGRGEDCVTISCAETPQSSIGSVAGSRVTATITGWSKDYDRAHAIAAAVLAVLDGSSITEEDIHLDGLRHDSGPTDGYSELPSGELSFAVQNTFTAQVRRG